MRITIRENNLMLLIFFADITNAKLTSRTKPKQNKKKTNCQKLLAFSIN